MPVWLLKAADRETWQQDRRMQPWGLQRPAPEGILRVEDRNRIPMKKIAGERISGIRTRATLSLAGVEFRVVWNEKKQEWNAFRNGVITNVTGRKKKKSAVDSAIREAKTELETSKASVVVVCLKGRKLETVWKGP
jgi:hypothetical protein